MGTKHHAENGHLPDDRVEQLRELAKDLKYGTLTLVFQDGVLVQIDRNEKIRVTK